MIGIELLTVYVCVLFNILFLIMHICVGVCINECRFPWRPEESTGSLGTGVTSSCEVPHMGARKQTARAVYVPRGCAISAAPHTGMCVYCALNMHSTTQPHQQPKEAAKAYLDTLRPSR